MEFKRKGWIGKLAGCPYWFYDEQIKHTQDSFIEYMQFIADEFKSQIEEIRPWDDETNPQDLIAFFAVGGCYDYDNHRYLVRPAFKYFRGESYMDYEEVQPEDLFLKTEPMPNGMEQILLF